MNTFLEFIPSIIFIWFILVLFKPAKFAPFFLSKPRLKSFGVFFVCAALFSGIINATMTPEEKAQKEHEEQVKQQMNELNRNQFARTLELSTTSQANEIENFLKTLGISNVTEIKHDETLDEPNTGIKCYRLTNGDTKNIFLYMNPNKTVQAVRYASTNLYKDGQILGNITDLVLTNEEEQYMRIHSEKVIQGLLKAPSTAKFADYSEYQVSKRDGIGTISGYVDAQNSFGAMIRSTFTIHYNLKDNNKNVTSVIFDGKEIF